MKQHNSLRDHVREYISNKIQNGELIPGDKLSEMKLCEELQISRTPTREALLVLTGENLLEYVSRKGFTVKSKSLKEKSDVHVILSVMDALAARLAVDNIGNTELNSMRECIDMIDIAIKYKNYPNYCKKQQSFHNIYRNCCQNEMLLKMLNELQNSFIPYTYNSDNPAELFSVFENINKEHRIILNLFEKHDGDALFEFLMNEHWQTRYKDMI